MIVIECHFSSFREKPEDRKHAGICHRKNAAILYTCRFYDSTAHLNGTSANSFRFSITMKYEQGLIDGAEWKENRFKLI